MMVSTLDISKCVYNTNFSVHETLVNAEVFEKRQRLFARIPPRGSRIGISVQDIAGISVDPALVGELNECLRSDDDTDVMFSLYFCEHLRPRTDFRLVAEPAFPDLASLIRHCL